MITNNLAPNIDLWRLFGTKISSFYNFEPLTVFSSSYIIHVQRW